MNESREQVVTWDVWNSLTDAMFAGKRDVVAELLDLYGVAAFNARDKTPLLQTGVVNDVGVWFLQELLDRGENVNAVDPGDDQGFTPLDYAMFREEELHNQQKVIEFLRSHGGRSPNWDKDQEKVAQKERDRQELEGERKHREEAPERFEFQGFTVVNGGLAEVEMKTVLGKVEGVLDRMKRKGFGNLLYGPLVLVTKTPDLPVYDQFAHQYKNVHSAAYFDFRKDVVVVNGDLLTSGGIVVHELGHRLWFKFMTSNQRGLWEEGFTEVRSFSIQAKHLDMLEKLLLSCAPVESFEGKTYHRWDQFDYNRFRILLKRYDQYRLWEVLEWVGRDFAGTSDTKVRKAVKEVLLKDMVIHTRRIVNRIAEGEEGMAGALRVIDTHLDMVHDNVIKLGGGVIQMPESTSEYGQTNTVEDFAEAFEAYVMNKPMPESVYESFRHVLQIRHASLRKAGLVRELLRVAREIVSAWGFSDRVLELVARMDEDDFTGHTPSGFHYVRGLHEEANAHRYPGQITLSDKFFLLDYGARLATLQHERAHFVTDQLSASEINAVIDFSLDGGFTGTFGDKQVKGINGENKPLENLTEAVSIVGTSEEGWLRQHYPRAYAVATRLLQTGKFIAL